MYIAIASLATFTAVISAKNPTFKYEIRCLEPPTAYKNVINTLKYKKELTFCVDNLAVDNLNGFYKSNSDYIYLDYSNLEFEKTIYHEYSHFLMGKKIKNSDIKGLVKSMNITDEKLTDITAFFLLLEHEKGDLSNVSILQFSYLEPLDLYSLDDNDFWNYIDEIYAVEGIKNVPLKTFDRWITASNGKLNK